MLARLLQLIHVVMGLVIVELLGVLAMAQHLPVQVDHAVDIFACVYLLCSSDIICLFI